MSIQMTLVPYYCNENVLRMFIAHARARIGYANWICKVIDHEGD